MNVYNSNKPWKIFSQSNIYYSEYVWYQNPPEGILPWGSLPKFLWISNLTTYILQLPRRPYFNCAHNMRRLIKIIGLLIMYFSAVFSCFITLMSGRKMLDSCRLHGYRNVGIGFTARILFSSISLTRGLIISLYFRLLTSSFCLLATFFATVLSMSTLIFSFWHFAFVG